MAMFPCSVGNHRYQGPQQSAYLGAINGGRSERVKKRLCPQHLEDLVAFSNEHLQEIDVNSPPLPNVSGDRQCFQCAGTGVLSWALFVNIYPLKAEPRAWYGNSCAEHVNLFLNEMGLVP